MNTLLGKGVSAGIGIAPILRYDKKGFEIPSMPAADGASELAHFDSAHKKVLDETKAFAQKLRSESGESEAAIMEAHCMILEDEEILEPIAQNIRCGMNAAMAIDQTMKPLIDLFAKMEDVYMRERAADIADICERLLRAVLGVELANLGSLDGPCILAAYDLTPSDTARMDIKNVAGILTEAGGSTSHTAIMARTLQIPAVVSVRGLLDTVRNGEIAAIDGDKGEVVILPDAQTLSDYSKKREALENERAALRSMVGLRLTAQVFANIGTPADAKRAAENDAEGIGLFRTEFLFMDRSSLPTEDEQFAAYCTVLKTMGEKPVIVRTIDIGGDKDLPVLNLKKEENPFLGNRAIRLCLSRPQLFQTQLRALLRASVHGTLFIMFPMIGSLEELRLAKALLDEARAELIGQGIRVSEAIKVGIMIEIPSAALLAEALASECDFFSIGTNDLTQYTLAVDRGNDAVAELYSHYHPAVIRLIHMTIEAAKKRGIPCGMCGEAAADPYFIPLLMGMGLDEFSVSPPSVLKTRSRLSELNFDACKTLAADVEKMSSKADVEECLFTFV